MVSVRRKLYARATVNVRGLVAVAVALLLPTLVAAAAKPRRAKDYASVALNVLPPGEAADKGPN